MKYEWLADRLQDGTEYILRLRGTAAEGWVMAKGGRFEVALLDLKGQVFLWTAEYETLAGAKRGLIAAAKRFGFVSAESEPEPEPAPSDEPEKSPKSIWEWDEEILSYGTWIEGNGLGIDGIVTPLKDGGFEGDVVLGAYVFRQEYPDEWSARRGVLTRAYALVEQAA